MNTSRQCHVCKKESMTTFTCCNDADDPLRPCGKICCNMCVSNMPQEKQKWWRHTIDDEPAVYCDTCGPLEMPIDRLLREQCTSCMKHASRLFANLHSEHLPICIECLRSKYFDKGCFIHGYTSGRVSKVLPVCPECSFQACEKCVRFVLNLSRREKATEELPCLHCLLKYRDMPTFAYVKSHYLKQSKRKRKPQKMREEENEIDGDETEEREDEAKEDLDETEKKEDDDKDERSSPELVKSRDGNTKELTHQKRKIEADQEEKASKSSSTPKRAKVVNSPSPPEKAPAIPVTPPSASKPLDNHDMVNFMTKLNVVQDNLKKAGESHSKLEHQYREMVSVLQTLQAKTDETKTKLAEREAEVQELQAQADEMNQVLQQFQVLQQQIRRMSGESSAQPVLE